MARVLRSIDIGAFPELVRRVENALREGDPVVLRAGDRELAIVEPAPPDSAGRPTMRRLSPEERAAFLASAGGWRGVVDPEHVREDLERSRGRSLEADDE